LFYVDSNVFIYPAIYDPQKIAKASQARRILLQIAGGKIEAYTSTLTWNEVVRAVWRYFGIESALNQGRRLLEIPHLQFLPVDFETISTAQDLAEKHKLKPRDSLHAGSALRNHIKNIISDDEDFDRVPNLQRRSISGFTL